MAETPFEVEKLKVRSKVQGFKVRCENGRGPKLRAVLGRAALNSGP
jgi:hypothetical protein